MHPLSTPWKHQKIRGQSKVALKTNKLSIEFMVWKDFQIWISLQENFMITMNEMLKTAAFSSASYL